MLANDTETADGFEEHVENVDAKSLADIRIMTDPDQTAVTIDSVPMHQYDAIYLNPDPKTTIYAKAFLETVQQQRIRCNLDPSSFSIMAKKFYLFKVLEEKDVPIPASIAISTEKAIAGIEEELSFPLIAKKFEGFEQIDAERSESIGEFKSFAEHAEHGEHLILAQEHIEGEVYDTLYIDGTMITLKLEGDDWRLSFENGATIQYHNLSSEQQDAVQAAVDAIGTDLCRVRTVGNRVIKVSTDPKLELFRKESGKDVYRSVAALLGGDED
jgi:glutathione synthase/RimK-type ligase-like ATP-grasp enzyme